MEELEHVAISRGLLMGTRLNGQDVAVPVQPAVVAAPVPVQSDVEARLNRARDREQFRFEIDDVGGVSAVAIDGSRADRMHRFFKDRPARISLGGQIYPGRTRDGHKLEVAVPARGRDLFHASALLRRSHPRGLPASGIVVTARFTDPAAQTDVLESARSGGQDLWSPAWKEGAGSVVGAITISRLFHGQPKGRSALEHEVGLYLPEDTPRDMAVKELGVVWVSRVAVDAPYRDRGIGEELLRILRASIGATLPWQPRLIEVMQSVTPAKLRESDNGFFTMAGYHRYEHATYTAPARMIGEDGLPRTDLTPLRTLYFWSRIEPPP